VKQMMRFWSVDLGVQTFDWRRGVKAIRHNNSFDVCVLRYLLLVLKVQGRFYRFRNWDGIGRACEAVIVL
jgi:hypothetical protein